MTKVLGVTRAQEEREEAGSCSHSVQTACSMFVCRVSVPLSFHSLSHPTPMTHPKVGTGPISLPRLPIPTMLSLPKAPSLGEQPLSLCKTANCTPARSLHWSWIYFGVRNKKIRPNVGNRVFEVRTPGRRAWGDHTSLGWVPLSLPVRLLSPSLPLGPQPLHIPPPPREGGFGCGTSAARADTPGLGATWGPSVWGVWASLPPHVGSSPRGCREERG